MPPILLAPLAVMVYDNELLLKIMLAGCTGGLMVTPVVPTAVSSNRTEWPFAKMVALPVQFAVEVFQFPGLKTPEAKEADREVLDSLINKARDEESQ